MDKLSKAQRGQFKTDEISDHFEIIKTLQVALKSKERIWMWQFKLIDPSERETSNGLIKKVDQIKNQFEVHPFAQSDFFFESQRSIFLFFEKQRALIEASPYQNNFNLISFNIPKLIELMREDFLEELQLTEKEDELKNIHQREMPRVQAKGQQLTLKRATDPYRKSYQYQLYDMSSGGAGILVSSPTEFQKGQKVIISSIAQKPLEPAIKAEVMSIRELEKNSYKVGFKFDSHPYQERKENG